MSGCGRRGCCRPPAPPPANSRACTCFGHKCVVDVRRWPHPPFRGRGTRGGLRLAGSREAASRAPDRPGPLLPPHPVSCFARGLRPPAARPLSPCRPRGFSLASLPLVPFVDRRLFLRQGEPAEAMGCRVFTAPPPPPSPQSQSGIVCRKQRGGGAGEPLGQTRWPGLPPIPRPRSSAPSLSLYLAEHSFRRGRPLTVPGS